MERERGEGKKKEGMVSVDGKEALVVCSDKNLGVGITICDIETGEHLLHIPTSASPPHGLKLLRNQYLLASQIHRPGSVGSGVIFTWPLHKPQSLLRSYSVEAVGPLSCTKDGMYLAGGAPSGKIYIWEVPNGRLMRNWHAHHTSITCLVFSYDDSLLISGSEDGMIIVWTMISVLDEADQGDMPPFLSFSNEHMASITGLLATSGSTSLAFVSSSLDGTCKVWDLVTGSLLQNRTFRQPITAIVLDATENFLFVGSADGSIYFSTFDLGLAGGPSLVAEDGQIVLNGHRGSITALTFSGLGLISASEDCTACLWDVANRAIHRRFSHLKGSISNLLVIPQLSLHPLGNHHKTCNQFRVSVLDKYPQPPDQRKATLTLFPSPSFFKEQHFSIGYRSADLLRQQILELETMKTPDAIQLKIVKNLQNQDLATKMAHDTVEMTRGLQSRIVAMINSRLKEHSKTESKMSNKRKMDKDGTLPMQGEEQA